MDDNECDNNNKKITYDNYNDYNVVKFINGNVITFDNNDDIIDINGYECDIINNDDDNVITYDKLDVIPPDEYFCNNTLKYYPYNKYHMCRCLITGYDYNLYHSDGIDYQLPDSNNPYITFYSIKGIIESNKYDFDFINWALINSNKILFQFYNSNINF